MDGRPAAGDPDQNGIFASAVFDGDAGCYIVKVANISPDAHTLTVKPVWKRGTKVDPVVAVTTLSADDPDAENTFDRPQRVVPVESQLALAADGTLADSLPANSFRIYEITLIKSN